MIVVSADIIQGCKNSNRLSQQQLYDHCYNEMLKLCLLYCSNRDDAAALYNEAMMKVFTSLDSFKSEGNIMGWIRRIVVNTCVDHCRKKGSFTMHPVHEFDDTNLFIAPEVYAKISATETIKLLQELPLNTALVFTLFVIEGYRHEEIASIVGISGGTSKWHLNEARRLLKEKITTLTNTKNYSNAI